MVVHIIAGIFTLIFFAGASVAFIVLLEHLTGVDMFTPFSRSTWLSSPVSNVIKSIVLLLIVLFVITSSVIAVMGEIPIGEVVDSEQWEPAL